MFSANRGLAMKTALISAMVLALLPVRAPAQGGAAPAKPAPSRSSAAAENAGGAVLREAVDAALKLLAPFVPHVASELWEATGHTTSLDVERWPAVDPAALVQEAVELPVQVNGKVRAHITVAADADETQVLAAALADARVQAHLGGRALRRHVVVPGRLVSLVA